MERRKFVKSTLAASAISHMPINLFSAGTLGVPNRKFRMSLVPGNIGVQANQKQTLDYAIAYGYEAMLAMPGEVAGYSDAELKELKDKMDQHKITWGSANLPVEFRKDKNTFKEGFETLKKHAPVLQKMGGTRMNTWILNSSNELTYTENMAQHAYRLGECARLLQDYDIRLGLEYVGPRTMMIGARYPFIGSMKEGKELIATIGEDNLGFVLDSFHWYCANDTVEDIMTLTPSDIITVDINDARDGVDRIAQLDQKREMPLTTGKIDLQAFIQALLDIGYDGPVRSEPFSKRMNDLDNDAALEEDSKTFQRVLALVGG